jgi:hypothetical protein
MCRIGVFTWLHYGVQMLQKAVYLSWYLAWIFFLFLLLSFVLIILEFALVSLELYTIWHLLGDYSETACFTIHVGVALSVGAKSDFCDSFNIALLFWTVVRFDVGVSVRLHWRWVLSILKMEAVRSTGTLVPIYQITWSHIPEEP